MVQSRRLWPIAGLVFLTVCLLIILSIFLYFYPWHTRVQIDGVVVDGLNTTPIPNARLVVSVQRWGFPYNYMIAKYGIEADEEGRFSFDRDPGRRFNNLIIEASSPSNEYGHLESYGVAKDIEVRTLEIPEVLKEMKSLYYREFTGVAPFMGVKEIEFIGEAWNAEKQ